MPENEQRQSPQDNLDNKTMMQWNAALYETVKAATDLMKVAAEITGQAKVVLTDQGMRVGELELQAGKLLLLIDGMTASLKDRIGMEQPPEVVKIIEEARAVLNNPMQRVNA